MDICFQMIIIEWIQMKEKIQRLLRLLRYIPIFFYCGNVQQKQKNMFSKRSTQINFV